jgi:hypothetical protein
MAAGDVLILHGVPADEVDEVKAKFKALGATEITAAADSGGKTFTLHITFPD